MNKEANRYELNNNYLTQKQKAEIELIYQMPLGLGESVFILYLILLGASNFDMVQTAYFYSAPVAFILGLLSWKSLTNQPVRRIIFGLGILGAHWGHTIISILLAVFAYFTGHMYIAIYAIISAIGISSLIGSFLNPAMYVYLIGGAMETTKDSRMHFKYVMAKKMWGTKFPFESN
jgi:hypothetical protein